DFPIELQSLSIPARKAPTVDAQSSSLNTSGSALICSQRANLHDRRRLAYVDQNLCRWWISQWDAAVMFRRCDDVMLTGYSSLDSDTLAAIVYFDLAAAIAHPHRLSRISPRYRVSVAFPRNVGIARYFA